MNPRLEEAFRRARLGDPRAFRTVADILGPDLVRFLTFYLNGDVDAAHDVAQETLLRAWDTRERIVDACHLRRWCYRVARCKAITWTRRRRAGGRRVETLEGRADLASRAAAEPGSSTPSEPPGSEMLGALRRALRRLPSNYAGPVHLFYVHGFSTREAAELLGIKRATMKMRLHRARVFLKREIHRDAARARAASGPRPETPP